MTDQVVSQGEKKGRQQLKVEMGITRIPVPAEFRSVWRRGVADLYDRLEEMVAQDKEGKHEL